MAEKRFTLRMDEELFNKISEKATTNRRSVAKEIELAIDYYLNGSEIRNKDLFGEQFIAVLEFYAKDNPEKFSEFMRNFRENFRLL